MSRSLVGLALAAMLFGGGIGGGLWLAQAQSDSPPVTVNAESAAPLSSVGRRNFVAEAVAAVGPAVVRLDTTRTVAREPLQSPFDDPFFREFFGDSFFPNAPFNQQPSEFQQEGQGSGLIIDAQGIILTNAHVVSDADRVTVVLRDGRRFEGRVQGTDDLLDLAVVRIDGDNLPTVSLGDSDAVRVGDWAIAVGNPLGLDNTVTLGIVSTLGRSSAEAGIPDKRLDFIQTDAAINPGNSGGPLLNQAGEVIGINTAIRANAQGIGFAIPINTVKAVQDQLARGEQIPHPYIGVEMVTLDAEVQERFNRDPNSGVFVTSDRGVLVLRVVPNSPAAAAGLRAGDIITAVDDTEIVDAAILQQAVERAGVGTTLRVRLERNGQSQQISLQTGNLAMVSARE